MVLVGEGAGGRFCGVPRGSPSLVAGVGRCFRAPGSGGGRRRLSLARALLRPAPWLVLDEPTEGLDSATEALVIARLSQRLSRTGQGLLLITHRPAPLALCELTLRLAAIPASLSVAIDAG